MDTYLVKLTQSELKKIKELDTDLYNKFKKRKKNKKTTKHLEKVANKKSKSIQNKMSIAISELKRLNKNINPYSVSKEANISYITARKYWKNLSSYFIASWSGGKDSTYMVQKLLEKGEKLDEIVFSDTGYEFPEMYDYIEKVEKYWKEKYPHIKITKLNYGSKETWNKWSTSSFTKGKYKDTPRGWPSHFRMDYCTRELKIVPFEKYVNNLGYDLIYTYVGIAVNEPNRVRQNGELYPLVEWKISEDQIVKELIKKGLHNPLYNIFSRTGCYLCPKQSNSSLFKLWKHYPNLWKTIEELQFHYKTIGSKYWKFKGYRINELLDVFKEYEEKGQSGKYLDEEYPIGCFCK